MGYLCATYQEVTSATALSTCPSCDFAFDLELSKPPEDRGGSDCAMFSDLLRQDALSAPWGVGTVGSTATMFYYDTYDRSWSPLTSYAPMIYSTVTLTPAGGDVVHLDWDYYVNMAYIYY